MIRRITETARITFQAAVMERSLVMIRRAVSLLPSGAAIGVCLLVNCAHVSAAETTAATRGSHERPLIAPVVVDGLSMMPGEVIESPPPPPTEVIEYYAVDAIGSTRVVFAPDGSVLGRGDFLPFGEELPGANLPSERFTGQERDPEAGLDYFGARSYQARTSRFSSTDPSMRGATTSPQRWNRYAYALNNPLRYVDPSGMSADACKNDKTCVLFTAGTDGLPTDEEQVAFDQFGLTMNLGFLNMGAGFGGGGVMPRDPGSPGGAPPAATDPGGGDPDPGGEPPVVGLCGGAWQPKCPTSTLDGLLQSTAIANPIMMAEAGGGAVPAGIGWLIDRAKQVHSILDPIAQGMRTTAVLETDTVRIVAGGATEDLTRAQVAGLNPNTEIAAFKQGVDAEMTALGQAVKMGARPVAMGVTREICPVCAAALEASGAVVDRLKGYAYWPNW